LPPKGDNGTNNLAIIAGVVVVLFATGYVLFGTMNPVEQIGAFVSAISGTGGDSASQWLPGEDGSEPGESGFPNPSGRTAWSATTYTLKTCNALNKTASITADEVTFFEWDATGNEHDIIVSDTSNDAQTVSMGGVLQGKKLICYASDTTTYPVAFELNTPEYGEDPESASYSLGLYGLPVKIAAAELLQYVEAGGANVSSGSYSVASYGETSEVIYKLAVNVSVSAARNNVLGADYWDPRIADEHHIMALVVKSDKAANTVSNADYIVGGFSANYYVFELEPSLFKYTSDGRWTNGQSLEVAVAIEATDTAGTMTFYLYDNQVAKDILNLNFGTALKSFAMTIDT
jgi:hypothetical protein